jgi:hypothetical protein
MPHDHELDQNKRQHEGPGHRREVAQARSLSPIHGRARQPEQQMHVGPQCRAVHAVHQVHHVMVVVPVDAKHHEAQGVGRERRKRGTHRREVRPVRRRQLEHQMVMMMAITASLNASSACWSSDSGSEVTHRRARRAMAPRGRRRRLALNHPIIFGGVDDLEQRCRRPPRPCTLTEPVGAAWLWSFRHGPPARPEGRPQGAQA